MSLPSEREGIKLDLHIHSKYSHDGILEPDEIVRIAKQRGLHGIAITDHNTIKGGEEAKQYETADFRVIIGAEIMTEKGEVTGLFLSEEIGTKDFYEVIAEIRAQDGIVVVPHPFDELRHSTFRVTEDYLDFIDVLEGFNSRCVFQKYNQRAVEFAIRYNLPLVGGSDAHYANEIGLGGIIANTYDIRKAIIQSDIRLFGKRSSLFNHARTKIRKLWRQTTGQTQV